MSTFPLDDYLTGLTKAASKRTIPSERNREIYHQVRVRFRTQSDVGRQFGINQQRVSAICRRVEKWRNEAAPWEQGELDGDARRAAERRLTSDRLEEIAAESFRLSEQSRQPIVTTRTGERSKGEGDKVEWNETVSRTSHGSGQHMKTCLAAVVLKNKLSEQPSLPPADRAADRGQCMLWIVEMVTGIRIAAAKQGLVPELADPRQATVDHLAGWFGKPPAAEERGGERETRRGGDEMTVPHLASGRREPPDSVTSTRAERHRGADAPRSPVTRQSVSLPRSGCSATTPAREPSAAGTTSASGAATSDAAATCDSLQPAQHADLHRPQVTTPPKGSGVGSQESARHLGTDLPSDSRSPSPDSLRAEPARRMFRGRPLRPR